MRIHQINCAHGLDPAFKLAHGIDRILHRRGNRQCEELRGHAARGATLAMFQQFDDVLLRLRFHLDQNLLGAILGQIGQQICGGVRIHLLDNVGGAARIERLDNGLLNLVG